MRIALTWMCTALVLLTAAPVAAQEQVSPALGIVSFDSDRLFFESAFGKRVTREIEAAGNELVAENRRLEVELADAEQDLTDRRASMTPEEFRPLADAFDTRVQESRQEQATKSRALNAKLAQERETFLRAATPILQALMVEAGAAVVLENRTVFYSSPASDITAAAIARLNLRLGEGVDVPNTPLNPPQD